MSPENRSGREEQHPVVMRTAEALQVLLDHRREDQVVITNQCSARQWPMLSSHPLDVNYNPSTMGGAIPLALGIALAQPRRRVIVVSGDGSLLMNLGCLVTVANCRPRNLHILLLNNGVYEVTGGQQLPASAESVDYVQLADSVGISATGPLRTVGQWRGHAPLFLGRPGPSLAWLVVRSEPDAIPTVKLPSIADRIARFRQALAALGER